LTIEKSHILVYNINEQNGYQDRVIKLWNFLERRYFED
jgi:hypothetical protein